MFYRISYLSFVYKQSKNTAPPELCFFYCSERNTKTEHDFCGSRIDVSRKIAMIISKNILRVPMAGSSSAIARVLGEKIQRHEP